MCDIARALSGTAEDYSPIHVFSYFHGHDSKIPLSSREGVDRVALCCPLVIELRLVQQTLLPIPKDGERHIAICSLYVRAANRMPRIGEGPQSRPSSYCRPAISVESRGGGKFILSADGRILTRHSKFQRPAASPNPLQASPNRTPTRGSFWLIHRRCKSD